MSANGEVALGIELFADPKALFAKLGEPGPIHRVTLPDGMPAWLVTGNQEVRDALADPRLVRSVQAAAPELQKYLGLASDEFVLTRHILFADPPDHTRMRRLMSQAFTRGRVERLRPWVQEFTDSLLDEIVGAGKADLVQALALPLPIGVICEMLGVPFADRPEFEHRAEVITGINASSDHDQVIESGRWFDEYTTQLIAARRKNPGEDLLTALLAAHDEGEKLSDLEVRSNVFLLLAAGFETTVNLIANGILALLSYPESLAKVRDNPDLMPGAIEEILRFDSPVSSITYRFATDYVKIGDVEIQPGEHVALSPPAANHDPAKFVRPEVFDIERGSNPHVSFGYSTHFCLGAPLARLEGDVAFSTVLRRLPDLKLAVPVEELTWKPSFIVHRLDHLPVTFTAS
ncbi:cytochrome P450 [Kibdelosporangium philippinense]|uniref:Cytochrome P450 n=1 Tax=Kibdelosporangium philippinense TaxID=211113 RepID=A0ABS8Z5J6_9PSEU|nr:cytochrome P450 [Kibdelosporangium philippinense]MCE7002323.1 cytochrome P450 [Kibdelosporangium philippinense]